MGLLGLAVEIGRIGKLLVHRIDGVARVAPFAAAGHSSEPITLRTAIFMTLRNEDPGRRSSGSRP
ncbi:MAG: hypothetical protein HC788_15050 [Sphingopyxis sp.]|nr:hypothetical protein [Sphingopyxis sp.]